ncbi:MAG: hypothetical protein RR706_03210 [Muribaculaceae bacterium]
MEMPELEKMTWVLALVLGEYVMVLFAVIADLISGVRKAKLRGEARQSKALRRTVDKIVRYYNALFALTIIDAMQIAGVLYLRIVEGYISLPTLPIFTLLGSLGVAFIEVKSIYEKAEDKEQRQYDAAINILLKAIKSPYLKDYINKNTQSE